MWSPSMMREAFHWAKMSPPPTRSGSSGEGSASGDSR